MSLPSLYALKAFECAAKCGSFTKAAEQLNITPSAISKHVQSIEHWFNCQLFTRHGPRLHITEVGQRLATELTQGFGSIERACHLIKHQSHKLRIKTASTVAMSWLLGVLSDFRNHYSSPVIEIASVWMDRDSVDFSYEPYDCAILLGNGNFGDMYHSMSLFPEWLIPICCPAMVEQAKHDLTSCELIHPSQDRRDWKRWYSISGNEHSIDLMQGQVFDTLEQGNMAAISGYGVSVGDVLLSQQAFKMNLLVTPFKQAIATGDGYYLVWPKNSEMASSIELLYRFLKHNSPREVPQDITIMSN